MDSSRTVTEEGSSYEQKTLELLQLVVLTRSRKTQIKRCRRHLNRRPLDKPKYGDARSDYYNPCSSCRIHWRQGKQSFIHSFYKSPNEDYNKRIRQQAENMVQEKVFGWLCCGVQVELLETQAVVGKADLRDMQSDAQESHTAE